MNLDAQLKLQAWLDGELSGREADEVKAWVASDAEARALVAELQNTGAALKGHEEGVKLPETREFFWSQIQREIARQSRNAPEPARALPWAAWFLRYIAPAGVVAALVGVMLFGLARPGDAAPQAGEMELTSDDMGSYTFRDQTARMTVVWFYDRTQDSEFTPGGAFASVDSQ